MTETTHRTQSGTVRRDSTTGRVIDVQIRVCDTCHHWALDCTCPTEEATR